MNDFIDIKDWQKANMDKAERLYMWRKPRKYTVGNSKTGYRTVKQRKVSEFWIVFAVGVAVWVTYIMYM